MTGLTRGGRLGAADASVQGAAERIDSRGPMPTTYDALVIDDGAQAYWKLAEPAGSASFLDSSANGLNLTIVNAASADGYQIAGIPVQGLASAVDGFGGAGGMYATSASPSFQLTAGQSFSFEIWMAGIGAGTTETAMFTRGYSGVAQDSKPWYLLEFNASGTVNWWLRSAANVEYKITSFVNCFDASYAARGPWHHIVGTYDNATTTMALYVDGQLQKTLSAPDTGWGTNAGPFALGRFNGVSFGEWFTCAAFYLRALTATEVLNHYEVGRAGVSWYPFQQSTDYGRITSALSTVQTFLNRIAPPIISTLHISTTHHLTGVGTLNLTGRGVVVSFDFVPLGWGYKLGLINVFENRLAQLEFANLLGDGVTEVPSAQYEQYENIRVYLFSDNVPLTLNYYVAPGAGIIVQQINI